MNWHGFQITSPYGYRTLNGVKEFHKGVDLFLADKAPIPAFTDGEVIHASMGVSGSGLGDYGIVVALKVGEKLHIYAHLSSVTVKHGDRVSKGRIIGYQGNTGSSRGSHLHFEIRKSFTPKFGWLKDGATCTLEPTAYIDSLESVASGATSLTYKAHVQSKGWLPEVNDNEVAGTVGKALRMEALIIDLDGVQVEAHVQGIGWQKPVSSGQAAGTVGQSLRMEAVKLWLTGELAKTYDIVYRVHVQNKGWLPWVKNDSDYAGTVGKSLRMEAIQIKLVKK